MEKIIRRIAKESQRIQESFIKKNISPLIDCAEYISKAFKNGRKLMLCGNGGSAADAQHIAAEFVNRFLIDRHPLPALALTTDTSIITSVANDYSYEEVFSKQIQALGVEGDILFAISTSGNSNNILSAIRTAKEKGLYAVGLIGGDGGKMLTLVDLPLVVESNQTPRVQETHILAGHLICELVEHILFKKISS
ncbi:MAG: D-sedoheptulose 7-phosphate isomerase [Deltaproteobacteria bacterium]|nr:D-sedoheptulose 7-phosphate isomerase [Deltaproteobacteria bacterium]MBW2332819.1 D-sedoheptulose 7-phosphate isomerase [Deltaproteobacteria bacterium]RLB24126.1 MAG: phosphoheptose isomerase [Deltaproteobacteria bacterium]HDH88220.1 SIS domain-containing protein [Desulfobacteraceae bacterium]